MTDAVSSPVIFYWRPGCPFCNRLERDLDRAGIELDKRNIWDDPGHAAVVRSIANGNETVPTLVVGPYRMVNPSTVEVLTALAEVAPALLPEGWAPPEPSRMARGINRLLGG